MLGLRGVPASYSGIERHVEEIGARLAAAGHEITVFCHATPESPRLDTHRGMRLRHLPTIRTKHLETITHTALAAPASALGRYDIVHFHALGPGLLAPIPKLLSRSGIVQTVHGLDAERAKWGPFARRTLRFAEWMSARTPDATITVSQTLSAYYADKHGRQTVHIPNGVDQATPRAPQEITRRWGLRGGDYLLFVGRLVPEKAPHLLVEAFTRTSTDLKLVIVGGSSHTDDYVAGLERVAGEDERVLLTGPVYGEVLQELHANAALFVSPSLLEGAPLTILEAVSYGTPVLASDIPAQVESLGDDGPGHRLFAAGDVDALTTALTAVHPRLATEREEGGAWRARTLAGRDWDEVAAATERLYEAVLNNRAARSRRG
jgi:glycosyltransferase involved in cell wall biosynthesis